MQLIFLYGMPATGKLTVARELANITGFPVFHNHLAVDLLLSTFEFGSDPFIELREQIWLSVFAHAAKSRAEGMIFTFAPEATVRPTFLPALDKLFADAGGTVEYIELTCPVDELKRRVGDPERRQFQKLASIEEFERLHAEGSFHAMAHAHATPVHRHQQLLAGPRCVTDCPRPRSSRHAYPGLNGLRKTLRWGFVTGHESGRARKTFDRSGYSPAEAIPADSVSNRRSSAACEGQI